MSNPAWPGSLPAYVLADSYDEKLGKQSIESPTDGGAVKTRRRFTRRWDRFAVSMILSPSQWTTFETFYFSTTAGGSLAFDWVHPRTQANLTFKFVGDAPSVKDFNGLDCLVSFTMERQG
jgi:hypothetical protein